MTPRAAALLSFVAAVLYATGLALLGPDAPWAGPLRNLAGAPVAACLLFLLSDRLPRLGPVARMVAAFWPLVVATLLMSGGGAQIGAFALWPFVAASLAAGMSLMPLLPERQASTLALLPFGAALSGCLGTGLHLAAPAAARLCLATPYHFVIFLAFCVVLVALADAATTALPPRRQRLIRALIALLPLLGFLGTIAGIIEALASLPDLFTPGGRNGAALDPVLRGLSTAFETTLIGLVFSAATGFLLTLLADRDDRTG